jgi:hypothetical protein
MNQLKQCADLTAKQDFKFKNPETNRTIKVREGDEFIVTSPEYRNIETAIIDRKKNAKINIGYLFSMTNIETLFEIHQ